VKTWAAVTPNQTRRGTWRLKLGARSLKFRRAGASRALLVAAGSLLASAAGCDDEPVAAPTAVPDAGAPCPRGTQGCACFFGSGCDDDLLCIAGRCLTGQGEEDEPTTPQRPSFNPNRPSVNPPGGASRDAGVGDAGSASGVEDAPDASADAG
jgi:hypothetical protein